MTLKKIMTMNMRLLLLLLFGSVVMYTSCQSTSAPIDSLAARVTENTSKDQILFRLVTDEADPAKDYFEIDSKDGKVLITGNSDLSLATGLNWYLKYVAGIHLSWNNPSQKLPEVLPLPQKKIRQATAMKNRYYLNYCTYSYSMAFWDWERWEKEIDWMAMHGINMPLSITGMEVVWYNLLKRIGYTTEEINEFISGPAFMAWWQMNNLEGWGGPNPDSWYRQQEALQKKIIARMRELGIEPVFPGYAGMVPRNIGEKLGYQIADPGKWCGFPRPAFLSTEDEHFDSFAAMYYEELEKLYGKAKYYSMDPFHEGGNTEGVDLAKAGTSIMSAMKKANPEAVWVMQAWQANPREAMVSTLDSGDLLVLDLYSEKLPQWGDPESMWYREKGFGKHDWLYCMLLNFGGNVGLHGRMEQLVNGYYNACAHVNGKTLLLSASGVYLLLTVIFRTAAAHGIRGECLPVTVCLLGQTVALTALLDTGNSLRDTAGEPVLTAELSRFPQLAAVIQHRSSAEALPILRQRFPKLRPQLLPVRTAAGGGLLVSVSSDWTEIGGVRYPNLRIALTDTELGGGYTALWGGEGRRKHERMAAAAAVPSGIVPGAGAALYRRQRYASTAAEPGARDGAAEPIGRGGGPAGADRA